MATKGTYVAYQPLQPVKYTVGDAYNQLIDFAIKRKDAQEAAKMKAAQDKAKSVDEIFKTLGVNPYSTIDKFTDVATKSYQESFQKIAALRRAAAEDPTNAMDYLAEAERQKSSYESMASVIGSKDFIDRVNERNKTLSSGEYFVDDNIDQTNALLNGMYILKAQNGGVDVYVPENAYADPKDGKMVKKDIGSVMQMMTEPPKKSVLKDFDTSIATQAKTLADEYSTNKDGNRTVEKKFFAENRAKDWINSKYGDYDARYIPQELDEYSKRAFKKQIYSEEDYKKVKDAIITDLSSQVKNVDKTNTKYMEEDIVGKKLTNLNKSLDAAKKKYDLAHPKTSESSSSDLPAGVIPMSTVVKARDKDGNNRFYEMNGMTIKGQLGKGDNAKTVYVTAYYNPKGGQDGRGGVTYGLSLPATNGVGMGTIPLSNKNNQGLATARNYLSNTDFNNLLKAAAKLKSNPNYQKGGTLLREVNEGYRNIDFNEAFDVSTDTSGGLRKK